MDVNTTTVSDAEAATRSKLLANASIEMTARDIGDLDAAAAFLPAGTEVFVTNLPRDAGGVLVAAASQTRRHGFTPVPHIVARNLASEAALDELLGRLSTEAGADRVLLLGGDRDVPAGPFDSALQLLRTGLLQKHGIFRAGFACYPEGHPRIPEQVLEAALREKLALARENGVAASLVSQFAFDAKPIIAMARRLRQSGITESLRIGFAGPVNRVKLLKYALRLGVGPSLRTLRGRADLSLNLLAAETPDALVAEVVAAQAHDASLGISGIHLFTFGTFASSAEWMQSKRGGNLQRK